MQEENKKWACIGLIIGFLGIFFYAIFLNDWLGFEYTWTFKDEGSETTLTTSTVSQTLYPSKTLSVLCQLEWMDGKIGLISI